MTQMILNIENPDIIPSLRKVLGQLKGVSVAKTSRTKTAKSEKEEILQDIKEAYTEVLEAQKTGKELPRLEDLWCSGNPLETLTISESQRNASWLNNVKAEYPDIEIIVK